MHTCAWPALCHLIKISEFQHHQLSMVHAAVLLVLAVLGSSRAEVLDGIDLDAAADMFTGEGEEGDSKGNVETFKVGV